MHLSDHIRWAAFVIRILIRRAAALLGGFQFLLVVLSSSCRWGRDIVPHPRIVPRDMLGQGYVVCGPSSSVFLHIMLTALSLQLMRMWSMVSGVWHIQHVCLSLYLGIWAQMGPIFCSPCIIARSVSSSPLKASIVFLVFVGFCSLFFWSMGVCVF